jgi:hypothetical protein
MAPERATGGAMIDGGLITGYLLAAVARGGRKILDRTVDAALDRLADAVTAKLGHGPENDLSRDPGNPVIRSNVARAVERASHDDPAFARDLAALQVQLDRSGGPQILLNQVNAQVNAQAFGSGNVRVGDDYYTAYHSNDYDPADELVSGRGPGRALAVVGLLIALAGFGGWIYLIFSAFSSADVDSNPFSRELVPGVPLAPVAFVTFLVGGVLYGLGLSMSKAARKRYEQQHRPGPRQRW